VKTFLLAIGLLTCTTSAYAQQQQYYRPIYRPPRPIAPHTPIRPQVVQPVHPLHQFPPAVVHPPNRYGGVGGIHYPAANGHDAHYQDHGHYDSGGDWTPDQSDPPYNDGVSPPADENVESSPEGDQGGETSSLVWTVTNHTYYDVQFEFHAQGSDNWWPGSDRAYALAPGGSKQVTMNCIRGEKICYGAWDLNEDYYWGSGKNDKESCSNCCHICFPSSVSSALGGN